MTGATTNAVMAGLDPAIHVFVARPAHRRWKCRFTTEARRARRNTETIGCPRHLRASSCLRGEL